MTHQTSLTLNDEAATRRLAAILANWLKAGDIVLLQGPMGSGKTALARGVIQTLTSPQQTVPSPTYTLVQPYENANLPLVHVDAYRLEDAEDMWALELESYLQGGIIMLEWPERAQTWLNALPNRKYWITFHEDSNNPSQRTVQIASPDAGALSALQQVDLSA